MDKPKGIGGHSDGGGHQQGRAQQKGGGGQDSRREPPSRPGMPREEASKQLFGKEKTRGTDKDLHE